jgi:hypothetical protein
MVNASDSQFCDFLPANINLVYNPPNLLMHTPKQWFFLTIFFFPFLDKKIEKFGIFFKYKLD